VRGKHRLDTEQGRVCEGSIALIPSKEGCARHCVGLSSFRAVANVCVCVLLINKTSFFGGVHGICTA
jgi:hypothetical protein